MRNIIKTKVVLNQYILFTILKLTLIFGLLLNSVSCNTTEPPSNAALQLTLEDVSCTEAWLQLTTNNIQLPANINLLVNNNVTQTISLNTKDSLLYIENLLPNQSYKFKVAINTTNNPPPTTNELTTQTMDTTSHNFTWQTFTFGQHSSSALYDVAIINENNIWAVGEIYMNRPDGTPDPNSYNAVHWNGQQWEVKRILFYTICGQESKTAYPAKAIFAFQTNEIWIAMDGDQIAILENGAQVKSICLPWSFSINKMWGSSSNDLYAVGNGGNIAHYQNGSWKKIESGTQTDINDIWGIITKDNKTILYCPVSTFFVPGDKKILKIVDGKVDSVNWGRDVRLYSAWAVNENILYVCGEGLYENKFGKWSEINIEPVGTNSVRGKSINDIIVAGDYGAVFHFNGVNWKMLNTFNNKGYSEVNIKGDIVAIAGNYQGKALVEIGRRN